MRFARISSSKVVSGDPSSDEEPFCASIGFVLFSGGFGELPDGLGFVCAEALISEQSAHAATTNQNVGLFVARCILIQVGTLPLMLAQTGNRLNRPPGVEGWLQLSDHITDAVYLRCVALSGQRLKPGTESVWD
jgi:hypothetical protein